MLLAIFGCVRRDIGHEDFALAKKRNKRIYSYTPIKGPESPAELDQSRDNLKMLKPGHPSDPSRTVTE